jgi:hypothetical protein
LEIQKVRLWERTGFIGPHEFGMSMIVIGLLALLLATWCPRFLFSEIAHVQIKEPLPSTCCLSSRTWLR